jgi:transcriptional regulator with XRE-family HTH domain
MMDIDHVSIWAPRKLLRSHRRARASQRRAAAGAGISTRTLRAIEAGHDRADEQTIGRLLHTYGMRVDELLPPRKPLDPTSLVAADDAAILQRYGGRLAKRAEASTHLW